MLNIKEQFPILSQQVWGHPLVYLDNGATTQKPQSVIDNIVDYYTKYNSNVHRGVHYLSQVATDKEEEARQKIATFINAHSPEEIVFTKGTTDSINLLADSICSTFLQEGDEILLSQMEHHSNIVPWFMSAERQGLKVKFITMDDQGSLNLDKIEEYFTPKTKVISITWVSNTLGTINDIESVIKKAHAHGIKVVIDAAQAIQHFSIDVQKSDIDYLVASGHKMYGPTGIGILYGKKELLSMMNPHQGGGSMIKTVTMDGFTAQDLPYRFEAGTPHIEGIIGLGAAIDFMTQLGMDNIEAHEKEVMDYAKEQINKVPGIKILANTDHQSGALSLVFDHCHPADVGELIDKKGIAVRVGQHCCQPIMDHFDISATLRLSFAVYTTKEDIDRALAAIEKAMMILS